MFRLIVVLAVVAVVAFAVIGIYNGLVRLNVVGHPQKKLVTDRVRKKLRDRFGERVCV